MMKLGFQRERACRLPSACLLLLGSCMPALLVPEARAELTVYWANQDGADLLRAPVTTGVPESVSVGMPGELGVALDFDARVVYSTDPVAGCIRSTPFSGAPIEVVVSGLTSPFGLAFDSATDLLYWTAPDRIQRAPVATGAVENIVTGLSDPVGVALDTAGGFLYWTEMQGQRIRRAPLNGGPVENVVTGLDSPYGIAYAQDKLYWSDWRLGRIQSAPVSTGAVEHVVTGLNKPVGVYVDAQTQTVYWTDLSGVQQAPIALGEVATVSSLPRNVGMLDLVDMPATQPLGRKEEVWVDFDTDTVQKGNFLLPYMTMSNAVGGVSHGGTIKILAGTTSETIRITAPVRLETFRGPTRIGAP